MKDRFAPNRGIRSVLLTVAIVVVVVGLPLTVVVGINLGGDTSDPPGLSECDITSDSGSESHEPTDAQMSALSEQIEETTDWFSLNIEYIRTCAGLGEIDWGHLVHLVNELAANVDEIEADARDGKFHRFTSVDVDASIENASCIVNEASRLCGIPLQ